MNAEKKIDNSDFVITSTFGVYESLYDENFEIAENTIHPFAIPHYAANPCGYTFLCDME